MFAASLLLCSPCAPSSRVAPGEALAVRDLAPFARMDAAVRATPLASIRTIAGVAKGIAALAATPLERARAAYVWTTTHVGYSLVRRDVAGTLRNLNGDCDGHAALYAALSKSLGVECVVVPGRVRFAVTPEAALMPDARPLAPGQWLVGHAWNAIRIEGRWGLVDTTMGSKSDKSGSVADDYFLPDPGVVATDHSPTDARWLLTGAPSSLAQAPLVRPYAWRLGIATQELELRDGTFALAWRKGLRASLQTESGSLPDRALVQPALGRPNGGTELRLSPTGQAAVLWLGLSGEGGWRPLAGYAVCGTAAGRLPRLMREFYEREAVLVGPFGRDLAAGRPCGRRAPPPWRRSRDRPYPAGSSGRATTGFCERRRRRARPWR
jgi:hypothetical protein